jgi:S-adenosylmethionine hydrolase
MARPAIVTLLTDFGTSDPYVAAMKGVILRACPTATIVDISHDIPPQDIAAAALVLAQVAPYFPPGTLHVVVVDPTVGTDRRILAGRFAGQLFLFPDNGVITLVAETMPMQTLAVVRAAEHPAGASVSMTFHGRDIFAPLAGQILSGLDVAKLGPQPGTYKTLDLPRPIEQQDRLVGRVIYADRFGNLISNIPAEAVARRWVDTGRLIVSCGGRPVGAIHGTYAHTPPGEALALFNSMGLLEVAVNRGSAAQHLGAGAGSEVVVMEAPRERL